MQAEELEALFDQQAPAYDQRWARLAAIRDSLHLLVGAVFSALREDAHILCTGAGTGSEMLYLAERFPMYRFTVVEPAAAMVEVCRRRAEENGIAARCVFHKGYLDSLPPSEPFDAATCLLVSQFILDEGARSRFFRAIAERLRPGAYLASTDLAADVTTASYQSLLEVWLRMMTAADVSPAMRDNMRLAYQRDVAVLPPARVAALIAAGGFASPIPFFQAGLIHGWYSVRIAEAGDENR